MATPSSPIDLSVQTGRFAGIGLPSPRTSRIAPPFSVTNSLPSGRNAIAVGWLSPLATVDSAKPPDVAAQAGAGAKAASVRTMVRVGNALVTGTSLSAACQRAWRLRDTSTL